MKKLLAVMFAFIFLFVGFHAQASAPDLIIYDFTWSPETPYASNDPVNHLDAIVTIKNIGDVSVTLPENMYITLYKGSVGVGGYALGTRVYTLNPGDSQAFDFRTAQSPNVLEQAGTFDFTAKVDGNSPTYSINTIENGLVRESNENNNTLTKKITIRSSSNSIPVFSNSHSITNETSTSAVITGTILDDGGEAVYERGIVWTNSNYSTNPTVYDNTIILGKGTGEYSGTMSGLTPSSNYSVRLYAKSILGIAYSDYMSFSTLATASTSVKVMQPYAGSILTQGAQNIISWTGGKNKVQIGLFSYYGGLVGYIELNGTSTSGSTAWDGTTLRALDGSLISAVVPGSYRIVAISESAAGNYCIGDASSCNSNLTDFITVKAASNDIVSIPTVTAKDLLTNSYIKANYLNKQIIIDGYLLTYDFWRDWSKTNFIKTDSFSLSMDSLGASSKWVDVAGGNLNNVNSLIVEKWGKYNPSPTWLKLKIKGILRSRDLSTYGLSLDSQEVVELSKVDEVTDNGCSYGAAYSYTTGNKCPTINTPICPVTGVNAYSLCSDGKVEAASKDANQCVTSYRCTNPRNDLGCKNNELLSSVTKQACPSKTIDYGCTGTNKYSSTTGLACSGNIPEVDGGCNGLNKFSLLTGKICSNYSGVYTGTTPSSISTPITRTLKLGIKGEDVKALQAFLNLLADGSFGPKTQAKVMEWQAANGLYPDGSFGKISRTKAGLTQ